MKKPLAAVMAILLAVAVAHAQQTPAARPDEASRKELIVKVRAVLDGKEKADDLIANERALQDAVAKADKSSFVSLVLLSDGFWTTREGFVLMKDLAEGLTYFKLTKWDMINPRVTWLNEDAAILSYVWTGTGTFGDQPVSPMALATTAWTRRNGKWLAVSHHQSDLRRP